MTISDEMLMAYADGELDAPTRARIEAAMKEDPEIAKRVAQHRALREAMQGAFAAVLREPVPERLIAAARGQSAAGGQSEARGGNEPRARNEADGETEAPESAVVDMFLALAARRKASARSSRWQATAMAASLLLGLGLGFLAWHGSGGLIQPG
ncbi:MAG TPA: zf-HC2 domain-containing protein, partial [Steroidobacteraceae bacterium]|nr:zf-HC2 domain-containing protein [Steroidobacteraceae bacterium]